MASTILRRLPIVVDTVLVGGGPASAVVLKVLGQSGKAGSVLAISDDLPWMSAFPRSHLLGQSRQQITSFHNVEFADPKRKMTAEELMRETIAQQVQAVEHFRAEDVDGLAARVLRVYRENGRLTVECSDGNIVSAGKVIMTTGVGPERTLDGAGVVFANRASPPRARFNEVTTALRSMKEDPSYWKGKDVTIYGGGATSAWIAERAMDYPIADLHWIANNFEGSNPGGRNSITLDLTSDRRETATICELTYSGDLDSAPQSSGLSLITESQGKKKSRNTDIVVCALGSDPMAPTGIRYVLGTLYGQLVPSVGRQKGVFAQTPDASLFVVSTALSDNGDFRKLIEEKTYPSLNPENRIVAGVATTRLSAEAAAEEAVKANG